MSIACHRFASLLILSPLIGAARNVAGSHRIADTWHRDQGSEETRRPDHPADAGRSGQAGAGSGRRRPPLEVRLDRAAARSDLREARPAQGGQVSAAWSLAGAYAIRVGS